MVTVPAERMKFLLFMGSELLGFGGLGHVEHQEVDQVRDHHRGGVRGAGVGDVQVVRLGPVDVALLAQQEAAQAAARRLFAVYATLPSYRAILAREGAADAADIAIIGNEQTVAAQVARLAAAGVTDLNCAFYPVKEDPDVQARSYAALARLAVLQ